jgi:hypothetical protein
MTTDTLQPADNNSNVIHSPTQPNSRRELITERQQYAGFNQRKARDFVPWQGWARFWLPYAFIKMPSDTGFRHVYLPLNRNYKPLGQLENEYVNYENFVNSFIFFKTDPKKLRGIWTGSNPSFLHLYNDGRPDTWADYYVRLAALLGHTR